MPLVGLIMGAVDEMVDASWPTMLASLQEAIASGDLPATVGQAHADGLTQLLDRHEDVAKNLYRAGYAVALKAVYDSMQLAMTTVEHDCTVPGHHHGPGPGGRIGRA